MEGNRKGLLVAFQTFLEIFSGSVIKVLQKGMGHGSHWGVIANPVKRKARA
jgi:hypothetical protein